MDFDGDEVYELRFRDLATGRGPGRRRAADRARRGLVGGLGVLLLLVHDDLWRQHQVWRHRLGTPASADELVLEEPDGQFELEVHASRTGDLVVIWSENRDTSEVWVVDAHDPTSPPRSVGGRRRGVEYHAEHVRHADGSDELLLVTNDGATEFRLARCPVPARRPTRTRRPGRPLRPEDPAERLERADAYAGHVVLTSRVGGRNQLRILPLDDLDRRGDRGRPGLGHRVAVVAAPTSRTSSTTSTGSSSWTSPT